MRQPQTANPAPAPSPFYAPHSPARAPSPLLGLAQPLAQAAERGGVAGGAAAVGPQAIRAAARQSAPDTAPRAAPTTAPPAPADGRFHSPYGGAFMSGIGTDAAGALSSDRVISGRRDGNGYAAYAPSPTDASATVSETVGPSFFNHTFSQNVTIPYSAMDRVGDIAAVTQYAAAADQGVRIERGSDGRPHVNIDWERLSRTPIQANYDFQASGQALPGAQRINYDSPTRVADSGREAVLDNLRASGRDPQDRSQFIAITGHSGGGQSSFYTALRMASDGYRNLSVVGVDMAMTPHERQALEALGVRVTNITSNNRDAAAPGQGQGQQRTSEVGEFIQTGMGGGANYYDLNVQRQRPSDMLGRHGIDNDANVTTTVRFAQYLDASGQHGRYTPELYQQFLAENPAGNVLQPEGPGAAPQTADSDLLSRVQDNRGNRDPAQRRTEGDFQRWFSGYIGNIAGQRLPPALASRLGDTAASYDGGLVGMLQSMGVDTGHIAGLERYNGGNVSNNWNRLNAINVPLPSWMSVQPQR